MTDAVKRKPGRPRLQAHACVRRVGVPLTEDDWTLLLKTTGDLSTEARKPLSKQEAIRILIRRARKIV